MTESVKEIRLDNLISWLGHPFLPESQLRFKVRLCETAQCMCSMRVWRIRYPEAKHLACRCLVNFPPALG